MTPVNLKSLAEQLNMSIATVSRALRDSHEVSEATKARVRALATALNYEPNAYASSLRRNLSKTIGVVIPKVANHFFALAINGIEEAARQSGYHVLIYLTHDDYAREVSIVQHLKGGRIDGLLMSVASGTEDFAHIKSLQETNLPIVFFDRVCAEVPTAKVTTNDYESGYRATEHLIQAGCQHIAHLLISNNLSIGQFRQQGYLDALQAHGRAHAPDLVLPGVMDNEQNVVLIRELLQRRPDIDGIFASVERLAISTYHVCRELGRRIPDDIKIIGFSNLEAASLLAPPLSTITQPAYDIGREAAKILLRAVEKKKPVLPSQSLVLESTLFERDSTARR
ncbi:LacI family DNA-binding transcriptional regulator [Hymenobacter armeniacus]|uniref:LacI family DNA-binding transcriptional regulator n=1 Tax=Hymenobacter armeniacus TaxID=2771358 RepID=A0ABR8JRA9_9BACT|nr:LacI family DNA-binding transcriptional regulator [Hymenobacter armeniacus]MBD2721857.1 LacI family DNA-binding transcriptional regulator [Hymenobacter armeniacus]